MKVRIPYYVVRGGRGYWQPNAKMVRNGAKCVACGPDGPDAWRKAKEANEAWHETMRATRHGLVSNGVHPSLVRQGNEPRTLAAAVEAERQKWKEAVHVAEAMMRSAVRSSDKAHEDVVCAVEAERKACEEIARSYSKRWPAVGQFAANEIADAIAARGKGSSQNEQD